MSGPRFDPSELRDHRTSHQSEAELAGALAVARELEALASATGIRPTEGFEDRVMQAVATEPVPRVVVRPASAVRGGRPAAFLLALRDAWGVATTGGRPIAIRAQALAFVALLLLAVGSLTTAGVVTVGGLLTHGSQAPSLQPAPTAIPTPAGPDATPSDDPSVSPEPTLEPGPTTSPEDTATPAPTPRPTPDDTPRPTRTPRPTDRPRATPTPDPTETPDSQHGGGGGGDHPTSTPG